MSLDIGLLVFRWRGLDKVKGEDDFSYTDEVIDAFLKHFGVKADSTCVQEVAVNSKDDMARVQVEAYKSLKQLPTGHLGALYFLWPCQPTLSGALRGQPLPPGYVPRDDLFALMDAMEAAGLPTVFPAASHIYRELAGKTWVPRVAAAGLGPPATVNVCRKNVVQDARLAAEEAVAALVAQGRGRDHVASTEAPKATVLKLPFSWESQDVMMCHKPQDNLASDLSGMFFNRGSHESCIVQAFVRSDLEIRFHVLKGAIRDVRYTRYRRCCHNCGAFTHFQNLGVDSDSLAKRQAVVSSLVFDGDADVLPNLELRAQEIIDKLLTTFQSDWGMLPPYLRFDFLVERLHDGAYTVWLNEVGELGSSLCGWTGAHEVLDVVFADFLKRSKCPGTYCPCTFFRTPSNGSRSLWRARSSDSVDGQCFGGGCGALAGIWKVLGGAMHAIQVRLGVSGGLFCEACSRAHPSTERCKDCGAVFCEKCIREGELRKLVYCNKCKSELCKQCIARSKHVALKVIAKKTGTLQKPPEELMGA